MELRKKRKDERPPRPPFWNRLDRAGRSWNRKRTVYTHTQTERCGCRNKFGPTGCSGSDVGPWPKLKTKKKNNKKKQQKRKKASKPKRKRKCKGKWIERKKTTRKKRGGKKRRIKQKTTPTPRSAASLVSLNSAGVAFDVSDNNRSCPLI